MPERAYTVAEIDRMRSAVEHTFLFGNKISDMKSGALMQSCMYHGSEKDVAVEARLRTYMLAGIEPEELE